MDLNFANKQDLHEQKSVQFSAWDQVSRPQTADFHYMHSNQLRCSSKWRLMLSIIMAQKWRHADLSNFQNKFTPSSHKNDCFTYSFVKVEAPITPYCMMSLMKGPLPLWLGLTCSVFDRRVRQLTNPGWVHWSKLLIWMGPCSVKLQLPRWTVHEVQHWFGPWLLGRQKKWEMENRLKMETKSNAKFCQFCTQRWNAYFFCLIFFKFCCLLKGIESSNIIWII